MVITVIVATHKKYRMPPDKCYLPLHVGKEGKEAIGYVGDDTGENISIKNPYYCELTGLYWMWKNVDADYLGLVQYRRYFARRWGLGWKDKYQKILTGKELERLFEKTDIILPKKRRYYIESIYSHYAHTHFVEHLDAMHRILRANCPEYLASFERVMHRRWGHMFNMFIMSRQKMDAYCRWLFPLLGELEKEIDFERYTPFQARLIGRVSELMLDVWVDKNHFSYKEMPVLNVEKVDWTNKGIAFLKAKFLGQKYESSF